MVMRLWAMSAFLLSLMAAASASAQLSCGETPRSEILYHGYSPTESEQDELATALGQLLSRFSLRCGWRIDVHVSRRSGGFEVVADATGMTDGCRYELRIRHGGRAARGGRGSVVASAIEEIANLGVSITPDDHCTRP